MKGIFTVTCFSTLRSLKKLVAEHYEGNFDMNFLYMAPQILIAERYGIYFDMILHDFEAVQNFVAKHYESRFWHDIPLKCSSKIGSLNNL